MWSSKNSKGSYNGITIHYWNSESAALKSRILDCSKFQNAHTSEEISADILKTLQKFGIDLKVSHVLKNTQCICEAYMGGGVTKSPIWPF